MLISMLGLIGHIKAQIQKYQNEAFWCILLHFILYYITFCHLILLKLSWVILLRKHVPYISSLKGRLFGGKDTPVQDQRLSVAKQEQNDNQRKIPAPTWQ